MRQQYIEQKLRWEQEQELSAPHSQPEDLNIDTASLDAEGPDDRHTASGDDRNVIEIMTYEDEAFSALISQMHERRGSGHSRESLPKDLEDEEELYQTLFMDMISTETQPQFTGQSETTSHSGTQGMDFSPG